MSESPARITCVTAIDDDWRDALAELSLSAKPNSRRRIAAAAVMVAFGALLLLVGVSQLGPDGSTSAAVRCLACATAFIVLIAALKPYQRHRLKRQLSQLVASASQALGPEQQGPATCEYVFSEDGVDIAGAIGPRHLGWDAFASSAQIGRLLCLLTHDSNAVLVDAAAMSGDDAEALGLLLRRKLPA